MSWSNPTPEEAAEELSYSRKRFNEAAARRSAAINASSEYRAERSANSRAIESCQRDKLNFEKRLEQIKAVVGILEGSGGQLASSIGSDIPTLVSGVRTRTTTANASYSGSMKSPDIPAADIEDALGCPDAAQDQNIQQALTLYKNEQTRLENALEELDRQIKELDARSEELTQKINQLNAEQASMRKIMLSSVFDMKHFKSFL